MEDCVKKNKSTEETRQREFSTVSNYGSILRNLSKYLNDAEARSIPLASCSQLKVSRVTLFQSFPIFQKRSPLNHRPATSALIIL